MGHRSKQTTHIYAKITNQKVNEDMKILFSRLRNNNELQEEAILDFRHNQYYSTKAKERLYFHLRNRMKRVETSNFTVLDFIISKCRIGYYGL